MVYCTKMVRKTEDVRTHLNVSFFVQRHLLRPRILKWKLFSLRSKTGDGSFSSLVDNDIDTNCCRGGG